MKLYMWTRVKTLEGYCPGVAYAVAENEEQAIDLIVESFSGDDYIRRYDDKARALRAELVGMTPTVYDSPQGFYEYGSM